MEVNQLHQLRTQLDTWQMVRMNFSPADALQQLQSIEQHAQALNISPHLPSDNLRDYREAHVTLLRDIMRAAISMQGGGNVGQVNHNNPHQRYDLQRSLTSTNLGGVWHAIDRNTGRQVAVKLSALGMDNYRENPEDEVRVLRLIEEKNDNNPHPNVIQLISSHHTGHNNYYWTVLEFCEAGDLLTFIQDRGGNHLPTPQVASLFRQIVQGVVHTHNNGFAHLDLKPENILVGPDGVLKVCDYGVATAITLDGDGRRVPMRHRVGTVAYMDPFVNYITRNGYDGVKADSWSLGIILFIMVAHSPPLLEPTNNDRRFQYIWNGRLGDLVAHFRMQHLFPPPLMDLLQRLLCKADRRMTPVEVLEHPFLNNNNNNNNNNDVGGGGGDPFGGGGGGNGGNGGGDGDNAQMKT